MALRLAGLSASALAFPPFFPPSRPKATAAGFLPFVWSGSGEPSNCSPMACSTTRRAVTVKSCSVPSRLGLLERLGITPSSHGMNAQRESVVFKLTHYPKVERRHTAHRRGIIGGTRLVRVGLDVQHFKASGRIPRRAARVSRPRATGTWRGTFRHHQLRPWHPDATSLTFSMSAMAKNGNPGSVCMGPDSATKMEIGSDIAKHLRPPGRRRVLRHVDTN